MLTSQYRRPPRPAKPSSEPPLARSGSWATFFCLFVGCVGCLHYGNLSYC
uniref:Uncharacterized protein n=1 Tax=Anguilla anguilla TaxID=7936 RepID=A0A0E9W7Z3_ANGAN